MTAFGARSAFLPASCSPELGRTRSLKWLVWPELGGGGDLESSGWPKGAPLAAQGEGARGEGEEEEEGEGGGAEVAPADPHARLLAVYVLLCATVAPKAGSQKAQRRRSSIGGGCCRWAKRASECLRALLGCLAAPLSVQTETETERSRESQRAKDHTQRGEGRRPILSLWWPDKWLACSPDGPGGTRTGRWTLDVGWTRPEPAEAEDWPKWLAGWAPRSQVRLSTTGRRTRLRPQLGLQLRRQAGEQTRDEDWLTD